MVTVTSALTRTRIERVPIDGPPGEHGAHLSGAEKTVSGLEKRQTVAPITRAASLNLRDALAICCRLQEVKKALRGPAECLMP